MAKMFCDVTDKRTSGQTCQLKYYFRCNVKEMIQSFLQWFFEDTFDREYNKFILPIYVSVTTICTCTYNTGNIILYNIRKFFTEHTYSGRSHVSTYIHTNKRKKRRKMLKE